MKNVNESIHKQYAGENASHRDQSEKKHHDEKQNPSKNQPGSSPRQDKDCEEKRDKHAR